MEDTNERVEPFWNPYLAGLLLGSALLASFLTLGAGLGASAGLARFAAVMRGCCLDLGADSYFGRFGTHPLRYYLVFMLAGTFFGGLVSALLANRVRLDLERGARFPAKKRALYAFGGGILVGFASRLAGGCTSGQALTGGAMLLTGSLLFMAFCFGGGYAFAWFVRRQWHD